MTERQTEFCDYPMVLVAVERPVVCTPKLRKGFKDKSNCPSCPKAGGFLLQKDPIPNLSVRPLRQRDIRRQI